MKRHHKIIIASTLAVSLIGGSAAYAGKYFNSPEGRAGFVTSYIASELELDEAQKVTLDALKGKVMQAHQMMRGDMQPLRGEIQALLEADSFDQAKALEMIQSRTAMVNDLAPELLAAFGTFFDGLNAAQKAEVLEMLEHRRGRMGRGHHRGYHHDKYGEYAEENTEDTGN